MDFKNKIKGLRIKNNLSQRDLAEDLKVSAGLIYQWEKGICTPNFEMLEFIADYFKTDINSLLGFATDKEIEFKRGLKELNLEKYKNLPDADKKLISEQFNALIDRLEK